MVFSETWESHLKHLEEVVKWLKDMDLKIKCSKCEFFKSKVHYLGYLVGADGVQSLPDKVTTIEALEPPQNIEELWHFLGLIRFYRKFIPFFTNITACLNAMLRMGAVFKWTEKCNNAFNLLKSELVKMPRIQYLNPDKMFKLFTDVSKHNYSSVLHQEETPNIVNTVPKPVPIAYFSGSFNKMQQLWNTIQKECYTVYRSIQKFSFYVAGAKCILYCNHKLLAPFFTMGMSSLVLHHWVLELQQFDIWFEHSSGKKSVVVNALSRIRTLGLYQDNGNTDLVKSDDDIVDNVVEEVHAIEWIPNSATYKIKKLNLDELREVQWQDTLNYLHKKAKSIRSKEVDGFILLLDVPWIALSLYQLPQQATGMH